MRVISQVGVIGNGISIIETETADLVEAIAQ